MTTLKNGSFSFVLLVLLSTFLPNSANAVFIADAGGPYVAVTAEAFNLNGSYSDGDGFYDFSFAWEIDNYIPYDYNDLLGSDPLITFFEEGVFNIALAVSAYSTTVTGATLLSIDWTTVTVTSAPVPEPSTILLLGSGLAGLAFYRRKKK